MKTCTKCGKSKPREDFYAHKLTRDRFRAECKLCWRTATAAWKAANPERQARAAALWAKANPDKCRAKQVRYRAANLEIVKARYDAWRKTYPEKAKAAGANWVRRYPHKNRAKTGRRRALEMKATPLWVNQFFLDEIYELAALRTKLTGYAWHVDHIVPLRSQVVCGLHVEHNLRVIPGAINAAKGNRHWPDMPAMER